MKFGGRSGCQYMMAAAAVVDGMVATNSDAAAPLFVPIQLNRFHQCRV